MKTLTYDEVLQVAAGSTNTTPMQNVFKMAVFWFIGYGFVSNLFCEFKLIDAAKFGSVGFIVGLVKESFWPSEYVFEV